MFIQKDQLKNPMKPKNL